jgi:hypothetical protein
MKNDESKQEAPDGASVQRLVRPSDELAARLAEDPDYWDNEPLGRPDCKTLHFTLARGGRMVCLYCGTSLISWTNVIGDSRLTESDGGKHGNGGSHE